jgi:hypothetical protein
LRRIIIGFGFGFGFSFIHCRLSLLRSQLLAVASPRHVHHHGPVQLRGYHRDGAQGKAQCAVP